MHANDNIHPVFAEIIEAFVNPPRIIRDMEAELLARMRSEDLETRLAEMKEEERL